MRESCIANHFRHYASLGPQELKFLESLEQRPVSHPRNSMIWHEGSEASHFYILRRGWAYSSRILNNGSRQVLDLFLPGDIVGLREYAYKSRLNAVHAITDVELCVFPKNRLQSVFATSPLLGQLFFALASQSQALLLERIINLGRRSARQRVSHLLAELSVRLDRSPSANGDRDMLPLSQTLLADLLGLSAVHINRTMRGLREDGLIELHHQTIKLVDIGGLKEISGFNPAYLTDEFISLLPDHRLTNSSSLDGATAEISFRPDSSLT